MNQSTFKQRLQSILTDNSFDREVRRQRQGKLDTKCYKNVLTTGKCFKKSLERKGKNYSVSILVDASGSMFGHKSGTVKEIMPKLVKTLMDIGVKVEINAFNILFFPIKEFQDTKFDFENAYSKCLRDGDNVATWREGGKQIFAPAVAIRNSEKIISGFCGAGHNFDAWALHQAYLNLLKQDGEKILLVLSDGEPTNRNWYYHTDLEKSIDKYSIPYEVEWARLRGIKTISLGICTSCVENYYPKRDCAVVENLATLYERLTKLLSINIKRK